MAYTYYIGGNIIYCYFLVTCLRHVKFWEIQLNNISDPTQDKLCDISQEHSSRNASVNIHWNGITGHKVPLRTVDVKHLYAKVELKSNRYSMTHFKPVKVAFEALNVCEK